MRTVAQLSNQLTSYLGVSPGLAPSSMTDALNTFMPEIYMMGMWRGLVAEIQLDCSAGYFVLPPYYESVLAAMINDARLPVQAMSYEYQFGGPGILTPPSGTIYGIVDEGLVPLMSEVPTGGIDELIFTCNSTFASPDSAVITYTDSEDGYAQVTLPLQAITVDVDSAADGGTGLTTLVLADPTTTLVAGLGIIVSNTALPAYDDTIYRIASITDSTHIKINKAWDGTTAVSGTLISQATLIPASTISSVESIIFSSLPGVTMVKDADDVVYAILVDSDGVAAFRRYKVPQISDTTTQEWTAQLYVKRRWIPVSSTSDIIYVDNLPALQNAMLRTIYRNNGDMERASYHWKEVQKCLDMEASQSRGGAKTNLEIHPWGLMTGPVHTLWG